MTPEEAQAQMKMLELKNKYANTNPTNPDAMGTIKELSPFEMTMQKYGIPALKGLQLAGGLTPISPITTGLTEGAIKSAQGANPMEALKQGGIAGGVDLGLTLGTMGLGKIPGVKNAIKSAVSPVGEFLTGIPKDAYRRVLDNPALLKGKFNAKEAYAGLGKKFSSAVKALEYKLGGEVGSARELALKSTDTTTSGLPQLAERQKQMYFPEGKVPAVTKSEAGKLEETGKALQPRVEKTQSKIVDSFGNPITTTKTITPTIADKQRSILALDGQINWEGSSDTATSLAKQQRNLLNEELRKEAPEIAQANDKFVEMMELKKDIGSQGLNPMNSETMVRNLQNKTLEKQDAIGELGRLSGTDVGEAQKDIWARDMFENLVPAKGSTTGGSQGMGNIARTAVISMLSGSGNLPAAAVASSFFSPLMHKYAIKYGIPTAKSGAKIAKPQLATMIADMLEEKTGGK